MQSAALGFMLAQAHFADPMVAVPSAVSVVFMVRHVVTSWTVPTACCTEMQVGMLKLLPTRHGSLRSCILLRLYCTKVSAV